MFGKMYREFFWREFSVGIFHMGNIRVELSGRSVRITSVYVQRL